MAYTPRYTRNIPTYIWDCSDYVWIIRLGKSLERKMLWPGLVTIITNRLLLPLNVGLENSRCLFWLIFSTKRSLAHLALGFSPLDLPTTWRITKGSSSCTASGVSPVITELIIHPRFLGSSPPFYSNKIPNDQHIFSGFRVAQPPL